MTSKYNTAVNNRGQCFNARKKKGNRCEARKKKDNTRNDRKKHLGNLRMGFVVSYKVVAILNRF